MAKILNEVITCISKSECEYRNPTHLLKSHVRCGLLEVSGLKGAGNSDKMALDGG